MMEVSRGVIDAPGALVGGDIIAEHQIQFKQLTAHAGDGGNGVMGDAVSLMKDKGPFVGV